MEVGHEFGEQLIISYDFWSLIVLENNTILCYLKFEENWEDCING